MVEFNSVMRTSDYDEYSYEAIQREHNVIKTVFNLTGNLGFIAGGFARYCLSENEPPIIPGDIDLFCQTMADYDRIVYRLNRAPNVKKRSSTEIEEKFEIILADGYHREVYSLQIIKPVNIHNMVAIGDPVEILKNFDFGISKCAITPDKTYVFFKFHEEDRENKLVIYNIHCPISSTKRVNKYVQKGFTIETVELLKLFEDYENRDDDWKSLIKSGLRNEFQPNSREHQNFARAMYFD